MICNVYRITSDDDATISTVYVDGGFVCFGLEDEYRAKKVVHETRIPAGVYRVEQRKVGGFHQRYSSRFADIHDGMLHIVGVPEFTNILIHCGNTDDDTSGCLLVGEGAITTPGNLSITSSTAAYKRLYPVLLEGVKSSEGLTIRFHDTDLTKWSLTWS
jgi:hypothetical protein